MNTEITREEIENDPALFSQISPMMQQYLQTRREYDPCILFYRLGDFYEMFFDDAVLVSRELELTLTGKNCGLPERAPMCGVPFHAVDSYVTRLVSKGYRIAICEQVEDPKTAKGLVKREVIRIVTPGTNTDMESIDEDNNHYIVCLFYSPKQSGIAVCDITTGAFKLTETGSLSRTMDELIRLSPSELLCNEAFLISGYDTQTAAEAGAAGLLIRSDELSVKPTLLESRYFDTSVCEKVLLHHFHVSSLSALGIDQFHTGTAAAGALLQYLYETQKNDLANISGIEPYLGSGFMVLDSSARRSLELTETIRDKTKRGSLLWVLDKTRTAMGARCLHGMIDQPLIDREEILARQGAIRSLLENSVDRDEIREYLSPVYDLERLLTRISYRSANPKDLLAFLQSLKMLSPIRGTLSQFSDPLLKGLLTDILPFEDLVDVLERGISEDAPLTVREGGIIRDGYDPDIDYLRKARTDGKKWLLELEEEDRKRTGIRNLKIKYNKVFGYYFDVTNSFKDLVPDDYIRKQTLVGSERFTTARLKELEDTILNAEEKLNTLEYDAFCAIRDAISAQTPAIQRCARALAMLDSLCSLALVAERWHYVCPTLNNRGEIHIKAGRHPVVEQMLSGDFIPNDTTLDNGENAVAVITGPNMAGKSTYMRQVALICLMAQIGSFVPASEADLCIVDRIFTRVGASDDLGSGQSTFMVEMNEVANILRNATSESLLILDEIGRGTSTFDGLSIAWAVIEHISNKKLLGAKTLFATHYHELTELSGKVKNVQNYCVAIKENGDQITFLRKIIPGGADRSYGIQVAKLAGVPAMVTDRAEQIAEELSENDLTEKMSSLSPAASQNGRRKKAQHYDDVDLQQMSLFATVDENRILEELKSLDITNLTPLDALNTLYRIQNELSNTWKGDRT